MNLEKLPNFESRKQYLTRKYKDMYNLGRFDHPLSMRTKYYKVRDRILHHYIGKSFDEAFSHFCKIVPKHYQHLFLEVFESPFSRWNDWSLDESKNIVHIKRERYITNSEWRETLRQKEENNEQRNNQN